jgi:hypothetical protein
MCRDERRFGLPLAPQRRHATPPNSESGQTLRARLPWFQMVCEKHTQSAGKLTYRGPVFVQRGSTTEGSRTLHTVRVRSGGNCRVLCRFRR